MSVLTTPNRFIHRYPLIMEIAAAALALAFGAFLLPLCIFYSGSAALGRYEGATAERIYSTVFDGLGHGSIAAWIVVLGPYALYLLFKALRLWWRVGANVT